MGDETPGGEQTLDQQLEALFAEPKSPAPAGEPGDGATPKPGQQPAAVASPPPAKKEGEQQPPAEGEVDPLLKALEEIKEEKVEEPAKPQLSDDQQKVLEAVPTVERAAELYATAQNYANFTGALEGGDFGKVEGMLQAWNPQVLEGWLEHVYAQKVASGEWVDRFIAEQEGRGSQYKGDVQLRNRVAQLETQLKEKAQTSQQSQLTQQQQQAFVNYNTHVNDLLEKINFNKADRRWVVSDLNARVAADPKVLESIRRGNVAAVNGLFKTVVKEYVTRDKEVVEQTDAKVQQQSQKKPPLGGAAATVEQPLPDDISQVPKGKEDDWMDQQLTKLKRSLGK